MVYCKGFIGSFSTENGVHHLGENLKGENVAMLSFKKDGWYIARFVDKSGIGRRFGVKRCIWKHRGVPKNLDK